MQWPPFLISALIKAPDTMTARTYTLVKTQTIGDTVLYPQWLKLHLVPNGGFSSTNGAHSASSKG